MAVTEKIKRPLIAHFLDVGETFGEYSAATWARLGKNVTEASTDYGAQTETEQDIISESATTEITGYQPTMSVSQQCTKGDEVFEYVNQKRRSRATLGSSHSWLLNIDMWDSTGESLISHTRQKYRRFPYRSIPMAARAVRHRRWSLRSTM